MPGELSSGLAAHLGFETRLMHGHDSCSWTALKAPNFAAAVPAKGRLDLGSLEAPCSSKRDPSKFRIGVPLVGKCALLLPHPLVRHHVWRNRDPAGAGKSRT